MGVGVSWKCKKCNYNFSAQLGIGYLFPVVYQEIVENMKNGVFGEQGKKFFKLHPDDAVNCYETVARCDECGKYMQVTDLSMYVPKKKSSKTKEASYIMSDELKRYYKLEEKYNHKCNCCGGDAEIIDEKALLKCPECNCEMEQVEDICWD